MKAAVLLLLLLGCLLLGRLLLLDGPFLGSLLGCLLACSFLLGHSTSSVKKGSGRGPSRRLPVCLSADESAPRTSRKPLSSLGCLLVTTNPRCANKTTVVTTTH